MKAEISIGIMKNVCIHVILDYESNNQTTASTNLLHVAIFHIVSHFFEFITQYEETMVYKYFT